MEHAYRRGPIAEGSRIVNRIVATFAVLLVSGALASPAFAAPSDPVMTSVIPVAPACVDVTPTSAGIKVYLVQRKLRTGFEQERYGTATQTAVRAFQRKSGLPVTGIVNLATWNALGITRDFCVDEYTVQPMIPMTASRNERIEAAITWAQSQTGRKYIWGSSGPIGFDCSGLVLQALYAAGVYLPTITTDIHQTTTFGTSSAMYKLRALRVPFAERQRGDLVFWGKRGSVSHVALYLGQDRVVEAVRPIVHESGLDTQGYPVKPFVVRVF